MATNSKQRKNHKKKVEARNKRLAEQKRSTEKMQREFIMNLIKQEQEKGLFENNLSLSESGPVIDGPVIDGPVLDVPVIDTTVLEAIEVVSEEKSDDQKSEE